MPITPVIRTLPGTINFTGTSDDIAEGSVNLYYSAFNSVRKLFLNAQMTGTVATLVGAIKLPTGVYPAPSANLGCGDATKAVTLVLKKQDGTVLATIGGVAGGVAWRTAASGFTLVAETDVDLMLFTNFSTATAFVRGLTF